MLGIVGPALAVITELLKAWNSHQAQKYLDQFVQLQLDINDQLALPYEKQDDQALSALMKKFGVICDAAHQELVASKASS